jgi:hypothetical protein
MGLRGGAFHPISDRGRLCCWPGAVLTAMHRSGRYRGRRGHCAAPFVR